MFIYVVSAGDQLWQIAETFHVSPEQIINANGLPNPNNLLVGQSLIIPTEEPMIQKTVVGVNGYLYFLGLEAPPIVEENGPHLTFLTSFAYVVKENGDLTPIDDDPMIGAAYENQVLPMMGIVNFSSTAKGQNIAHVVLNSEAATQNLLNNIISIMKRKGYWGLNIDFEYVLPEDRERYNDFLRIAVEQLHREGFFVTSAVAPKYGPEQRGLLYEAIDYPVHGSLLDFVILMTYEWGYRMGPPEPTKDVPFMRRNNNNKSVKTF